jgi:hypothetical protein
MGTIRILNKNKFYQYITLFFYITIYTDLSQNNTVGKAKLIRQLNNEKLLTGTVKCLI